MILWPGRSAEQNQIGPNGVKYWSMRTAWSPKKLKVFHSTSNSYREPHINTINCRALTQSISTSHIKVGLRKTVYSNHEILKQSTWRFTQSRLQPIAAWLWQRSTLNLMKIELRRKWIFVIIIKLVLKNLILKSELKTGSKI